MNAIFTLFACAALANAGGIPSYSISEIQPDRQVNVRVGPSGWSSGLGLLSSKQLLSAPIQRIQLAPLSLSRKSISIAEPTILSAPLLSRGISVAEPTILSGPLLSKGLSLGEPSVLSSGLWNKGLSLGEPLVLSSGLVNKGLSLGEPTILSSGLLGKGLSLGEPMGWAEPEITSRTIVTRSQPIITRVAAPRLIKTLSVPIAEPTTIIRSQPLISKSWGSPLSIGEPLVLSEPLGKNIITSQVVRSEPILTKTILSEPTLLSSDLLLGGLGSKLWKK